MQPNFSWPKVREEAFKATRIPSSIDDEKEGRLLRYAFVMNSCFIPGKEKWRDETSTSSQMKWIACTRAARPDVFIEFISARRVARRDVKWRTLDGSRLQTLRVPCNFFSSPFPFNAVYRRNPLFLFFTPSSSPSSAARVGYHVPVLSYLVKRWGERSRMVENLKLIENRRLTIVGMSDSSLRGYSIFSFWVTFRFFLSLSLSFLVSY